MTQEEFNRMLEIALSQGMPGGYFTSGFSGEEIDAILTNAGGARAFTVTIPVSAWSGKRATVSNEFFASTGAVFFHQPDEASYQAYVDADVHPLDVTVNGQCSYACGTVPKSALTISVVKLGAV